jgi:hypothetical protein
MTTRDTKAKRVAIYSRYSSDLQNDRSIEDQIAVCEKVTTKNGWFVAGSFYDRPRLARHFSVGRSSPKWWLKLTRVPSILLCQKT